MQDEHVLRRARRRPPARRLFAMTGRADIVVHDIASDRWQAPPLTIACLSDMHVMAPWTPISALEGWVRDANALKPDVICLLGDYVAAAPSPGLPEAPEKIAAVLSRLEAPLGVHAILGNHDWIDDPLAKERFGRTSAISQALTEQGIRPLINSARRIGHAGSDVWLVGLDSQTAGRDGTPDDKGRHDPDQAFAEVPDESLAVLLAHEPDYFVFGDRRPALQLSGHTHGGQANFFGWRPFTPSEYSSRYAYGHVVEEGQHLVVSGGLGYTHVPLRIAQPPEITLVRMSAPGDRT